MTKQQGYQAGFPIAGDFACEVCGRSLDGLSLAAHAKLECTDGIVPHLLKRIEALERGLKAMEDGCITLAQLDRAIKNWDGKLRHWVYTSGPARED